MATTRTVDNGFRQPDSGRANTLFLQGGQVTANGTSAVAVTDTRIVTKSIVMLFLVPGQTAPLTPAHVDSLTAASGFTVKSVAGDTAIYNYIIIETP